MVNVPTTAAPQPTPSLRELLLSLWVSLHFPERTIGGLIYHIIYSLLSGSFHSAYLSWSNSKLLHVSAVQSFFIAAEYSAELVHQVPLWECSQLLTTAGSGKPKRPSRVQWTRGGIPASKKEDKCNMHKSQIMLSEEK